MHAEIYVPLFLALVLLKGQFIQFYFFFLFFISLWF